MGSRALAAALGLSLNTSKKRAKCHLAARTLGEKSGKHGRRGLSGSKRFFIPFSPSVELRCDQVAGKAHSRRDVSYKE